MNTLVTEQMQQSTDTPSLDFAANSAMSLREAVQQSLKGYFDDLQGQSPAELYDLVLKEIEKPLFTKVMDFTHNNQSRAAILLGISRGTLRKKLKEYGLL